MQKIAVQLFGHLRTYRKTYKNFNRFLVNANVNDGYQIDIFMHCWDQIESAEDTWHNENISHAGITISADEMHQIKHIYNPITIQFESQKEGRAAHYSQKKVNNLRLIYEAERQTKYDWVIMTRTDILFHKPFQIDSYLMNYETGGGELAQYGLPDNFIFAANNIFTRMNIHDPRHVCECDLLWFGRPKYICHPKFGEATTICIDYRLYKDFSICRFEPSWKRILKRYQQCAMKMKKWFIVG